MSNEKELIVGLYFKEPNMNAPDFVKMNGSIKIEDLGKFLREKFKNGEEWINFQVNLSKDGTKIYAVTDNWKPEKKQETKEMPKLKTAEELQSEAQSSIEDEDDLPY